MNLLPQLGDSIQKSRLLDSSNIKPVNWTCIPTQKSLEKWSMAVMSLGSQPSPTLGGLQKPFILHSALLALLQWKLRGECRFPVAL